MARFLVIAFLVLACAMEAAQRAEGQSSQITQCIIGCGQTTASCVLGCGTSSPISCLQACATSNSGCIMSCLGTPKPTKRG
ncbi:hypothetical protein ABFS83_14G223600 [Erythranthe nasuta]